MAERHLMALRAMETTDLMALCNLMLAAVKEATDENAIPFYDPPCRLIGFQIAFASNGDATLLPHIKTAVDFCRQQVMQGPNAALLKENELVRVPPPQAS